MLRRVLTCLTTTLLLPSFCLANPEISVSAGEFLTRIQTAGPRAVVTYCAHEVPELKTQLEAEYERFSENITLAMEPLRKRLGQKLLEPTPIATNHFDEIATNLLAAAKQFPSENYCPWLLSSMQKSSPEKLRVTIEAAFARYEALAAQRQPNAAK